MNISETGLDLIRRFEGKSNVSYLCPAGKWTIGYGHTGPDVKGGMRITDEVAEQLLLQGAAKAERIVKNAVKVRLNQNHFDALVSFVFNVGPGKAGERDGFVTLKDGRPSTLLRRLNEGDYFRAADQFPLWKYSNGKELAGLVARRAAEKALFLKPSPVK